MNSVKVSLHSPEKAYRLAEKGLAEAREQFKFVKDGKEVCVIILYNAFIMYH